MGVVRRYIDFIIMFTFPYSTCISSFLQQHSYLFIFLIVLVYVILCNIANIAQRTFEIVQKSSSREHGDIIISTRTHVDCACESRDFHV